MSVGKNSIKRAAGKTAAAPKTAPAPKTEEKDEIVGAAPELANSCSTPAPKAAKKAPAKKAPAKKTPAKKTPVAAPSANLRPETAAAVEATVSAPVAEKTDKVQVTEELPYYLL
jgi:hypothetical protein